MPFCDIFYLYVKYLLLIEVYDMSVCGTLVSCYKSPKPRDLNINFKIFQIDVITA